MLTNFYNGWNLDDAIAYFPTKKKFPAELKPGNAMSKWVLMNLLYLEDAVGRLPEGCRLPPSPIKGVKPFGALCSDRVKQAKS